MEERNSQARSNVLVVASLTLSVVSLFVAISGVANAGRDRAAVKIPANSVGAKQLKSEAVTPPDIAPNAITTRALAATSVQSSNIAPAAITAPAIANGAVTSGKLSEGSVTGPKIGPNAVSGTNIQNEAVTAGKIGPRAVTAPALSIPEILAHAANLSTTQNMGDCQGMNFVEFAAARRNPASMFNAAQPTDLVAPVDGVYSLSLTMAWSDSSGYVRGAYVSRARGGALDLVGLPAAAPGPPGYGQTIDAGTIELQAGDALRIAPVACGAGMTPGTAPTLTSFDANMKWVAQPGS